MMRLVMSGVSALRALDRPGGLSYKLLTMARPRARFLGVELDAKDVPIRSTAVNGTS